MWLVCVCRQNKIIRSIWKKKVQYLGNAPSWIHASLNVNLIWNIFGGFLFVSWYVRICKHILCTWLERWKEFKIAYTQWVMNKDQVFFSLCRYLVVVVFSLLLRIQKRKKKKKKKQPFFFLAIERKQLTRQWPNRWSLE